MTLSLFNIQQPVNPQIKVLRDNVDKFLLLFSSHDDIVDFNIKHNYIRDSNPKAIKNCLLATFRPILAFTLIIFRSLHIVKFVKLASYIQNNIID